MAILAKFGYRAGLDVATLLSGRFVLAAAVLWVLVALRQPTIPPLRTVLAALGLGAFLYSAQAGFFFAALTRIDASLASLLLYTYPVMVFVIALLIGRETATRAKAGALMLASGGTVLVLLGAGGGAVNETGVILGLAAAVAYSSYILVADRITQRLDPILLAALVTTGAATVLGGYSLARGGPQLDVGLNGWLIVAAIALASTVLPLVAFLHGLVRVGPATASIVSTVEPVVTVSLAVVLFGDVVSPVQAAGGVLVASAIVLLRRRGRSLRSRGAAAHTPAAAPARAFAHHAA